MSNNSIRSRKKQVNEMSTEAMKQEIEAEQKAKEAIEWSNMELEGNVRAMEMNVLQLEAGNLDADDSEIRQKYENQKQLNLQLQEQKRWLEHELEQIKQKIQNEKMDLPDPFSLDWDNLSETELKRLVGQLERTRNDLRSDLREMQWRLDKEGQEFHHHDDFARMYQAEIKNLNRILESLSRNGVIPPGLIAEALMSSATSSFPSTGGMPTPGGPPSGPFSAMSRKPSSNSHSPPRGRQAKSSSPVRRRNLSPVAKKNVASKIDNKPPRSPIKKTGPKVLPKIEKSKEQPKQVTPDQLGTVKEEG